MSRGCPNGKGIFVILQLVGCLDIIAGRDDFEQILWHCKRRQRTSDRLGREISLHPRGDQAGLERFEDMGVERKLHTGRHTPQSIACKIRRVSAICRVPARFAPLPRLSMSSGVCGVSSIPCSTTLWLVPVFWVCSCSVLRSC